MTLKRWLEIRGIDPNNACAIDVATDGLKQGRDNLMSISCTGSKNRDIGTVFISGADPKKEISNGSDISSITEVSPEEYENSCVSIQSALSIVNQAVEDSPFIAIWYSKFSKSWMSEYNILEDKPYLDIMSLVKMVECKIPFPVVDTVEDLQSKIQEETKYIRGGYGFDAVCSRCIPGYDGDCSDAYLTGKTSRLERKVYQLWALYKTLITTDI